MNCCIPDCNAPHRPESPRCTAHELDYLRDKVAYWRAGWFDMRETAGRLYWEGKATRDEGEKQ